MITMWSESCYMNNKVCRHTIISTLSNESFDVDMVDKEIREIWVKHVVTRACKTSSGMAHQSPTRESSSGPGFDDTNRRLRMILWSEWLSGLDRVSGFDLECRQFTYSRALPPRTRDLSDTPSRQTEPGGLPFSPVLTIPSGSVGYIL